MLCQHSTTFLSSIPNLRIDRDWLVRIRSFRDFDVLLLSSLGKVIAIAHNVQLCVFLPLPLLVEEWLSGPWWFTSQAGPRKSDWIVELLIMKIWKASSAAEIGNVLRSKKQAPAITSCVFRDRGIRARVRSETCIWTEPWSMAVSETPRISTSPS